jgi:hypothetical protein
MQSRTAMLVALAGLAIVAVVLGLTGPHLAHLYDTTVANCQASNDCPTAISSFLKTDRSLQIGLDALVVVVPGVIGLFWGAPLVARELETGTWRLAWTQSISRTRWVAVKLAAIGLASMIVAGLLSLMVSWWSSPVDKANAARYASFERRGVVPIGYAALAFSLGVIAGVLVRRSVPAMAAVLVSFVGARLAITHWVRPHLISARQGGFPLNSVDVTGFGPLTPSGPSNLITGPPNLPNAWIYSTGIADKSGHALTTAYLKGACPRLFTGNQTGGSRDVPQYHFQDCVAKIAPKFHEIVAYQPASRYWAFQWYELAIYLAMAAVLGGLCVWWVSRRLA